MKRCPRCKLEKPLEAFDRRRGDRRQAYCRECRKEYQRNRPRVLLAKRFVRAAKKKPCADCGILYPYYVMDFDHRPGAGKCANLAVLTKQGAPLAVLKAEVEKCDVVCANCHRVRTYLRNRKEKPEEAV